MIKEMNISCPHCNHSSKIFLSIDPNVIILNCPDCGTPLVVEEDHVLDVGVTENYEEQKPEIQSVLDLFSNDRASQNNTTINNRNEVITQNDILDLKIELNQHIDVADFIKNI